jgi:hypothetical protein
MLPLAEYTAPVKGESLNPNLANELQYGSTFGAAHLVNWLKEHMQRVHNPPYEDWEILNTAGNTDGVDGIARTIFDRGDACLVEEFGELQQLLHESGDTDHRSVSGNVDRSRFSRGQLCGCADGCRWSDLVWTRDHLERVERGEERVGQTEDAGSGTVSPTDIPTSKLV